MLSNDITTSFIASLWLLQFNVFSSVFSSLLLLMSLRPETIIINTVTCRKNFNFNFINSFRFYIPIFGSPRRNLSASIVNNRWKKLRDLWEILRDEGWRNYYQSVLISLIAQQNEWNVEWRKNTQKVRIQSMKKFHQSDVLSLTPSCTTHISWAWESKKKSSNHIN